MRIIGLHTFLLIKEKKMVSNQYIDPFDRVKTYSIGFDRMFNTLLEKNHQVAVGYPPYNIQQTEDFKYEIEMVSDPVSIKKILRLKLQKVSLL